MEIEELIKKLGYDDIQHLEDNVEQYGSPLSEWWKVIKELINKRNQKILVLEIIDFLCERNSFNDWWFNLDDEIEKEIIDGIKNIIDNRLNKKLNKIVK